jgi:hypothetical protein
LTDARQSERGSRHERTFGGRRRQLRHASRRGGAERLRAGSVGWWARRGGDPPGGALVLRPRLATVEIDPTSPQVSCQVQALHRLGEWQGRWPPQNRPLARTGVDLDPRNDAEFEVLIILSPHTLLADGCDEDGRNIYSADDHGGLWLKLTADENAEVAAAVRGRCRRGGAQSTTAGAPLAAPFRLAISGIRARSASAASEGLEGGHGEHYCESTSKSR